MCFIWTKCQSQVKIRPINCDVTKSAAKKLHPFIRNKILLPLCFFFWDFRQECISNEAFSIERKSLCGKLVVRLSKHLFLNKIFNDQSCAVITVTIVCCNMVTLLLLLPWPHPKRLLAWRLPRPMSWPQLYVNPNDDQLWSKQDPWPGLAQSRIPPHPPPPHISSSYEASRLCASPRTPRGDNERFPKKNFLYFRKEDFPLSREVIFFLIRLKLLRLEAFLHTKYINFSS